MALEIKLLRVRQKHQVIFCVRSFFPNCKNMFKQSEEKLEQLKLACYGKKLRGQ